MLTKLHLITPSLLALLSTRRQCQRSTQSASFEEARRDRRGNSSKKACPHIDESVHMVKLSTSLRSSNGFSEGLRVSAWRRQLYRLRSSTRETHRSSLSRTSKKGRRPWVLRRRLIGRGSFWILRGLHPQHAGVGDCTTTHGRPRQSLLHRARDSECGCGGWLRRVHNWARLSIRHVVVAQARLVRAVQPGPLAAACPKPALGSIGHPEAAGQLTG